MNVGNFINSGPAKVSLSTVKKTYKDITNQKIPPQFATLFKRKETEIKKEYDKIKKEEGEKEQRTKKKKKWCFHISP